MIRYPKRGEIWLVNLNPGIGHEQIGIRPALVISDDNFNKSLAEMLIVLPVTSKYKGIPFHVSLKVGDTGLKLESYVKTEDVRSISKQRLHKYIGFVDEAKLNEITEILGILLGF
jgi:mRNA interferase MazF